MSRWRIALLVVAAVLVAVPTAAPQPAPQDDLSTAARAAASASQARDWAAAERAYLEAARLAADRLRATPDDLDLANARNGFVYNAACSAALAGRADAAFELLESLVAAEWYDNAGLLAADPDLASLRENAARFGALEARARAVLSRAAEGHAEGLILRPERAPAPGRPVPGIVALHGGGGNIEGWAAAWQGVANRAGAVIVLVRGCVTQDVGAFSYDQRNPTRDAARIEEWVERALAEVPALDERELFLSGFSQGGGMAWVLGLQGDRPWRGIVPIGGYVQVAVRDRLLGEPRHALAAVAIVGEHDEDAIRDVNRRLTSQGGLSRLRARLEVVPDCGHGLPADLAHRLVRAMRWCRRQS